MNISVIIPTYNRYGFLKRALASVYAQTLQAQEVIVIDDGSTDTTRDIQKDFPSVTYIYQENSGVSSARNLGIKQAKYEWIAFLDSDDEWHKEKLQMQVNFHKANKNSLMSYTDEVWVREGKAVKVPRKFQKIGKNAFLENLSFCNIAPSSVMMHQTIFQTIGVFDESLEVCEDYDLWLRIASQEKIGLVYKKLLIKYAGHKDQLSFKHWGMDRFRVLALQKLLKSLKSPLRILVKEELLKKYGLLLKGAMKYDKIQDIYEYQQKIKKLEQKEV